MEMRGNLFQKIRFITEISHEWPINHILNQTPTHTTVDSLSILCVMVFEEFFNSY